ncbi:MAG: helix-turn-helix domain-containing protein [Anaerolineaceae bacterium]|nr:helix-turn-helix domain-containing protein [Anaerolineaceae bacterium]
MSPQNELAHEFVVDDIELLKVIAHSTRLDILQSLKHAKTVKEIAKLLKLPATKLYYHVNLMEKHGLIQVVETNVVSGIVEKKYQVVASNYRIDNQLLTEQSAVSENMTRMVSAMLDVTRSEIQRTMEVTQQNPFDASRGILWRATLRLTAEQYEAYYGRLQSLLDEIAALSPDSEEAETALYGLTVAYYPVVTPAEDKE